MIHCVHTQKNKNPLAVRNNQRANDKKRYPLMSQKIVTPKIELTKLPAVMGEYGRMISLYRTPTNEIVTYDEALENHTLYQPSDIAPEVWAKRGKAKKSSRKSSTSNTQSNKWQGSSVHGESAYTSQFRSRYNAMAELVSRVNGEVAL